MGTGKELPQQTAPKITEPPHMTRLENLYVKYMRVKKQD
jgi:hypothetical protein